jgi:nucleoporin NUP159
MSLDANQNETTMLGFELDLKNTMQYDVTTSAGETISVPPPPVVWAYGSDGTVTVWYVVNTRGTPYPGMAQETTLSQPAATPAFGRSAGQSAFGKTGAWHAHVYDAYRNPC